MSYLENFLEDAGQDWHVRRWVDGTADEYKQKSKTLDAGTTIRALRAETAKERVARDMTGQERTIDVQLLVAAGHPFITDIEDASRTPPIAVSPSGISYDVIALGREGEVIVGMQRLFLVKRRSTPVVGSGAPVLSRDSEATQAVEE